MSSVLRSGPAQRLLRPLRDHLNQHSTRVSRKEIATSPVLHAIRTELAELRSVTDELARSLAELSTDRAAVDLATRQRLDSVDDALATVRLAVGTLQRSHRTAEDDQRELRSILDSFRCSIEVLFGPTGRYQSRLISDDALRSLVDQLGFAGGSEEVAVAVHQAYRLLIELELRGAGRLAGSTPNVVGKLAAISLLAPTTANVLEIGTLFGIGALGVARRLAGRDGSMPHLTIVDPFAGHQIQPGRSDDLDVSQTFVSRELVELNLRLGGVGPESYRLLEGFSGDQDVRRSISDRRYHVIVVDGDHGRDAALSDLELAEALAAPGALVVLDDYGDPAWPGVAEALTDFLSSEERTLELVGAAATSAFLRSAAEEAVAGA